MVIFRCDDVSPNTNMLELNRMFEVVRQIPGAEFWSVVSMFGRDCEDGSVYPDAPFKDREREFFYAVNRISARLGVTYPGRVVSHGLLHVDHSRLQFDAQEMSIVTSCRYLETDTFVPPFNRYNETTEAVCRINGINLVRYEHGWRCLDREDYDPSHHLWYFHPWRFTAEKLKEKLSGALSRGV